MLQVETIAKIRRDYHVKRKGIKQIARERCVSHLGGSCERGIYNNLKTAVDSIVKGHGRKINRRYNYLGWRRALDVRKDLNPRMMLNLALGNIQHKIGT